MRSIKVISIILLSHLSTTIVHCQGSQDRLIIQEVLKEDRKHFEEYENRKFGSFVIIKKGQSQDFWVDLEGTEKELDFSLGFYHSQGRTLKEMIQKDDCWVRLLHIYLSNDNQVFRISKESLSFLNAKTKIVTNKSRSRVFRRKEGWDEFYKKFPDSVGIYEFSKPVIDREKAIIYVGLTRGDLHGAGRVIFLEKLDDQWKIVHEIEIWVS